jgi:SAM-dependent methyltransferase
MPKQYDRAYFDRWYRGKTPVTSRAELRRKVSMAVSIAEYFLRRPARTVLDIGCGEGAWLTHLRALRPRIAYTGLDPSEYVIERFGGARNIRRASFGELPSLQLAKRFDLIVCSDVLHYVADGDIRAGIREIVRLLEGVAVIELLTREDDIIGDLEGLTRRPAAWYRNIFDSAGLVQVAPYCWLAPSLHVYAAELERP